MKSPDELIAQGYSVHHRFQRLGVVKDLSKAIGLQHQAISRIENAHIYKPGWLGNIGSSYLDRFECLGKLDDINRAINYSIQAVSFTCDGHPGRQTEMA